MDDGAPGRSEVRSAAVIGAGVIGASWAALFLAHGLNVRVFDPAPHGEDHTRDYVARAWPLLLALGSTTSSVPGDFIFHPTAQAAVKDADFIQESVPERIEVKAPVYAAIEGHAADHAVIATSSSGMLLSELQTGLRDPSRLVIGHPFNPPHLIPLVELYGNAKTSPSAINTAVAFYESLGKEAVLLKKEVPGHVANRLQAALWREAVHLAMEGVASVRDIDRAVMHGPGLRWAVLGPNALLDLGGGAGGLQAFCDKLGPSFQSWWEDLGDPQLDENTVQTLVAGVAAARGSRSLSSLGAERDAAIADILRGRSARR